MLLLQLPVSQNRLQQIMVTFSATAAFCLLTIWLTGTLQTAMSADDPNQNASEQPKLEFSIRSIKDGRWSDPNSWHPARVPGNGDRVLVSRDTTIQYDVANKTDVIRLLQIVGRLEFARDRDTELNVGIVKVQNTDVCSETGFACDLKHDDHEHAHEVASQPALVVGTLSNPIPADKTARIRLHYLEGMNKDDAPAIACCSATMDFHGSPLSRTWMKLDETVAVGSDQVTLAEPVTGWRVGDEVIVTSTKHVGEGGTFRKGSSRPKPSQTEERTIKAIDGVRITLNEPLKFEHLGSGEYRGEVANLSRNVIVESADPDGVRGHTVYHRHSTGGISYARFAHLGKEGVLGRYAIHYHLIGDTMRGSAVLGAAIVDSHNRWVTIHGTQYLVVRDCVGYQSVGHGYFMEDGTEIYNLLDRNLAVHAANGKRLPDQVLPFDPNDGAGFWWANGRNSLVRNVACENDEYGYRYDMQHSRYFNSTLPILQPDGSKQDVDVRTIGIWRFEDNEAHSEGFYGIVIAANGNNQPDSPIEDQKSLEYMKNLDWTGPDTKHPHTIRNLSIWGAHYAFRPHSPSMLAENVRIHDAVYGIYRPAFENQVYRNLHISMVGSEPFNRGMDDASAQTGKITVDGFSFVSAYGNQTTPLVQISDNNLSGDAETHLRNVSVNRPEQFKDRWPLINRGVGTRAAPVTTGVPIYIHDYFGSNRHAKVVSTAAKDLLNDGNEYKSLPPLTGDLAVVAEVSNVEWPELLQPVDDIPPATVILSIQLRDGKLLVSGISHDNGEIVSVTVNEQTAEFVTQQSGVLDWQVTLDAPENGLIIAKGKDAAGNVEQTAHETYWHSH